MWTLGRSIRAREGLSAEAALRLPVESVTAAGLECQPAPEPPDFVEHGVIIGWNPDPDAKSARLDQQNALAVSVPIASVLRPPT